ncbi:MAG: phosphoglycerate kinase [Candidatus Doudnabacteria bacterium]
MIKSITSVRVTGRRVILRAGFDVPLKQNIHTEEWEVADDNRVKDILPTLRYLIKQGAKIVIIAHLDRPEGWKKAKSLWPVAVKLAELVDYKLVRIVSKFSGYKVPTINFLPADIRKKDYSGLSRDLPAGSILFLENLRFYKEEEENDLKFIDLLAGFGDVYANEAFSVAHRQEASTFGLAKKLPAYAGISFMKELRSLSKITKNPRPPLVILIGGIKIEDKVHTIHNLAKHASNIIVGGGVANTFLKALGYEVGRSKISDVPAARDLLRHYKQKLVMPVDVVVATDLKARPRLVNIDKVRPNDLMLDIGPESIRKFSALIKLARSLAWNGPFGLIEDPRYRFGSKAIALTFASRSKGPAFGVVGGGETVEVLDQAKVSQFIDHVSTGGGAMLEFLAGKPLPAIKALETSK